jgi:hypothetical protein
MVVVVPREALPLVAGTFTVCNVQLMGRGAKLDLKEEGTASIWNGRTYWGLEPVAMYEDMFE